MRNSYIYKVVKGLLIALMPVSALATTPPDIANLDGDSLTYTVGVDAAVIIDQAPDATVSDTTPNFNGGTFSVSITTGGDPTEDLITVQNSAAVAINPPMGVGDDVLISGVVIGTLANAVSEGNDFVVNLNGNSTVTRVETLLRNIRYQNTDTIAPTGGARNIQFTIDDGVDGVSAAQNVTVTVQLPNVSPQVSALPSDITVTEDTLSNVDLSAASFSDANGDDITLTLTVSAGTFATPADGASVGGGVTETLVSSTQISLVGAPADINTYLDTTSNIQYTGASNVNGGDAATITVVANDGEGSGDVNLGTVNIDITPVNDAPVITNLNGDSFTYAAGSGNQIIDQGTDSTISDDDSSDFSGGNLTATITSGEDATEDQLRLAFSSVISLGGDVAGSSVRVNGTLIGTLANNIDPGNDLVVNFNANSTPALVQDLLREVRYENIDSFPTPGARNVRITVNDGDGGTSSNQDITITVAAANSNPAVAALPSDVTVTEDTLSNVDLSAASFSDADGDDITLTLTASAGAFASPADGAGVGSGVTETLVSSTQISLIGAPADINTYLNTASNIQYTSASNVSGNNAATITVVANDGVGSGDVNLGTVNVNVTPVNDDPTVSGLPAAVTVTEDTQSNVDLSAASFADVDSANITVTLTASAGTFATPADGAGVGGGVTETLVSLTVVTLVGAPADINTYLDTVSNIQYTGAQDLSGNAAASFTVSANDGDGSGSVNLGTVNINITAINDNPAVAALPTDISVTEDTLSNVDLSGASFSDADGDDITLTLTASAGAFASPTDGAGVGSGVTETLVSSTVITLLGAPADINTYLDTASNVQYTGASNVSGDNAATLTVVANDGAGSGDVNLGTVNIDIIAANDDPTISGLPATVTVTEDTQSNVDLSAASFADVDSASITVTLTASAGTFATPADGAGVGGGVTETLQSAIVIELVGAPADINTYLDTVSNIQYTGAQDLSGNAAASFTVNANDGDGSGSINLGTVNINITAINDNPIVAALPSDITVTEDTLSNVDLSAASFSDADGDDITLTLTASAGAFASPTDGAGVGSGVTETLVSSIQISLVGAPADINTYLNTASNIQYTSASNVSGDNAATLTVVANDGSGDVNLGTVNIDITAANDDPTISGLPATVTVTEDTQSNVDLSAASFADVDSASITVTLTASSGTFATPADGAGVGGGVIETLQSTTVIELVGAPADINTYLDTVSNIQYTAAQDLSGNAAASFTVNANDGDGSGNVNLGTVNINITAINDTPSDIVATSSLDAIPSGSTGVNAVLSGLVSTDVDGPVSVFSLVPAATLADLGTCSSDGDNALFNIDGNNLRSNATLDERSFSICIQVSDGASPNAATYIETLSLTIVNSLPVIDDGDGITLVINTSNPPPFNLTLSATDVDVGDILTWSINTQPSNGSATVSAINTGTSQTISYTNDQSFLGNDSFVVEVSDGAASDTIIVTVVSVVQNAIDNIADNFDSSNDGNTPTQQDFIDAGITGVDDDAILDLINNAVATQTDRAAVDSVAEIQILVNAILEGQDADGDGLPNLVEGLASVDTDGDAIADRDDPDSDNDGIADSIENGFDLTDSDQDNIIDIFDADVGNNGEVDAGKVDTNFDGVNDDLDNLQDILDVLADDADQDGIPDMFDAVDNSQVSASAVVENAIEEVEALQALGGDLNNNGIEDNLETEFTIFNELSGLNEDGDSQPNHRDLDSDNDGVADVTEAGLVDLNNDALLDAGEAIVDDLANLPDTDSNSVPNFLQVQSDGVTNDLLSTDLDAATVDTDNDGRIDDITDADSDGLADVTDSFAGFGNESDTPPAQNSSGGGGGGSANIVFILLLLSLVFVKHRRRFSVLLG